MISGKEWSARVRAKDAESIYPQAWSLIHFLVYSENRKYEKNFQMFLFGLSRGMPWEKAFAKAYGNINIGQMEEQWLKYIKNKNPTDYELTARRLDFLANGMLRLHEQHNLPVSLEDLRNKLQKMGFSYVSDIHGKKRKMSANDNANYRIPYGSNSKDHGFFLVDKKFRQPNENTFSNKPTLLNIATSGLEPNALVLTWRRSKGKYNYQIDAKPSNIVHVKSSGKNIASKAARGNRADTSQASRKDRTIREWKSKSSGHTVKAVFLKRKGNDVQLERKDGKVITIPIAKLCEEDQSYLESIQE